MTKRGFLRNALMALAVSFVPRVLQPLLPEIMEEEMVDLPIKFTYVHYVAGVDPYKSIAVEHEPEGKIWIMRLPKSSAETLVAEYKARGESPEIFDHRLNQKITIINTL